MKKLMIAAAAAAMVGGAFAALPDESDTIAIDNNIGVMHNVAITVKTLMPTVYDSTKTKGCAICTTTTGDKCYLFEQGTLKINGIFASCNCDDGEWADDSYVEGDADMFKYGYFWLGSGKNAVRLFPQLAKTVTEYKDLPIANELGIEFTAARYGKTMKKAVVMFGFDNDVEVTGIGFGTYTDAKYKYDKKAEEFVLKATAKVSASGSVVGFIPTEKLVAYLVDQKKISADDVDADYVLFPAEEACTIALTCDEGDTTDDVPFVGTFTVKSTTVKALSKVIPTACWAE